MIDVKGKRQSVEPFILQEIKGGVTIFNEKEKNVVIQNGVPISDITKNEFANPIACNEVIELTLKPGVPKVLYGECHLSHDDQLRVISGKILFLVLFKKRMYYIPLDYAANKLLVIPRLTWHTAINFGSGDARYFNLMKIYRHQTKTDYQSAKVNHTLDMETVGKAFTTNQPQSISM